MPRTKVKSTKENLRNEQQERFWQKLTEVRETLELNLGETLTEHEFADTIGISYSTIYNAQTGKHNPSHQSIEALAKTIGISFEALRKWIETGEDFDETTAINIRNPRNDKQERFWQKILEARKVTEANPRGILTEAALGEALGLSPTAMQNMRKGANNPSDRFIRKLAEFMGTSFDDLKDWVEYGKKPANPDSIEQILNRIRAMYVPDLIKVMDTAVMRLQDLELPKYGEQRLR